MSRIANIRLKTERAIQHIENIETRMQAWRASDPYGIRVEDDPQTGDRVHRIDIRNPIPHDFALLIGEAIYQLRSALEHAAWQLVVRNGEIPNKRTAFPICKEPPRDKTEFLAKVKGISPAAVSVLDATQPYRTGDDTLWKLSKLNNIDKHAMLLIAAVQQKEAIVDIELPWALENRPPGIRFTGTADLEDGTEICRLRGPNAANANVNFQFTFDIAFNEPPVVVGEPVLKTLREFASAVEGVIDKLAPFL